MLYHSNFLSDTTTIFDFLCTQELKNWKITKTAAHVLAHFNCYKCAYILKVYFSGNTLVYFKFLASSFSLLRPRLKTRYIKEFLKKVHFLVI